MGTQENLNKFKIGICHNVGNCTHIGERQAIPSDIANSGGFKCKYCGAQLQEAKKPKTFFEKYGKPLMYTIIILVLSGIGFAIWKFVFDTQEIAKINLSPKSVTLVIGKNPREHIKATVVDKKGQKIKDAKVTFKWSVADDKIATVTQGGEVTAVKKGNTTITVKIEGLDKRAICKVEVKELNDSTEEPKPEPNTVYIKQISIKDGKDFTLAPGGTKTLDYIADPEGNDEEPEWESSNPAVATVSEDGVVKAVGEGSATISIKAENVSASVKVTVKKKDNDGDGTDVHKGRYRGTLNLGYASFSGDILNGKPDGAGVLTYKQRHVAGRDYNTGEQVFAESGERVDGTWNNGYLSSGTLIQRNGNVIKIKY